MPVEIVCTRCSQASTFDDTEVSGGEVECPKCGSTIRVDGGDALSETMRIDLKE
ncbi:MAG: hypothetical protein KAR83_03510 [Thermodesulfovibrionales bacterium]|nr:hypothetical protein [Thermodesulfovibrionales bacterium]